MIRELDSATLKVEQLTQGIFTDKYEVEILGGNWPPDIDLIKTCDRRSYGGYVESAGNSKIVWVYKD